MKIEAEADSLHCNEGLAKPNFSVLCKKMGVLKRALVCMQLCMKLVDLFI